LGKKKQDQVVIPKPVRERLNLKLKQKQKKADYHRKGRDAHPYTPGIS